MSKVYCPMCGWNKNRSIFHPEEMDDDIWGAEVHGKGRGKGFRFDQAISLLSSDDDLVKRIGQRCLSIINFLIKSGDLSEEEVREELGFESDGEEDEENDGSAGDSTDGYIQT